MSEAPLSYGVLAAAVPFREIIFYLTQSVFKVILQKSTPPQIVYLFFDATNIKNKFTNLCWN